MRRFKQCEYPSLLGAATHQFLQKFQRYMPLKVQLVFVLFFCIFYTLNKSHYKLKIMDNLFQLNFKHMKTKITYVLTFTELWTIIGTK